MQSSYSVGSSNTFFRPRDYSDRLLASQIWPTAPSAPAPAPGGFAPSVSPHYRRRRLRADADGAGVVEVGAVGGDAADEVLGGQHRCHLPPTS